MVSKKGSVSAARAAWLSVNASVRKGVSDRLDITEVLRLRCFSLS